MRRCLPPMTPTSTTCLTSPVPSTRSGGTMTNSATNDGILGLVAELGGPTTLFRPPTPERLTTRCSWFADDDRLVLVTRRGGVTADAEYALAYGLAYAGDRELLIVTTAAG